MCAWSCRPKRATPQIFYDGHTLSMYDAATNTLYRYTPPATKAATAPGGGTGYAPPTGDHEAPDRREDRRSDRPPAPGTPTSPARRRPTSPASPPTRCASRPRKAAACSAAASSPSTPPTASPLRAAIYSSTSSSPVIELAATRSLLRARRSLGVRIHAARRTPRSRKSRFRTSTAHDAGAPPTATDKPHVTTEGHGPATIAVLEEQGQAGRQAVHGSGAPRRPAEGEDQRRQRQRAAHRARHAAQLRALRRALPARRRGRPAAVEALARGPLAWPTRRPEACGRRPAGQGAGAGQALQGGAGGRSHRPERPRRRRLRVPRPERRGQDDDAADGARADHADRGHRRAVRARPDARRRAGAGGRRGLRRGAALLPLPERAQEPRAARRARRRRRRASASTRCSRSSS